MRTRLTSIAVAVALIVPALVALTAAPASATVFSNPGSITLNDPNTQATATPYPSTIAVSGLTGTISSVTATLNNATYLFSQDIDALLVGPGGQSLILVANLGPNSGASKGANNSTLTFSDGGTLPTATTPWGSSSTFKPVNFPGFNEVFPSPAPAGPLGDPGTTGTGATLASVFGGGSPNGTWSLFVITNSGGDGTGTIAGGWSLNIVTASAAATTTTLASAPNPSFTSGTGSSVTLTATVSSTSSVSEGTVAFKDGGTTISGCGAVAVSSGQAACTTVFSTEGPHALTAAYGGTTNFGPSNGTVTQVANNHTTGNPSPPNFCNTGSITLNNPSVTLANATPYPSNVFVTGLTGTVSTVFVTLNNVTYSHSQDIDVLLVGPGGQSLILVADLGPNSGPGTAVTNDTLSFMDAASVPVLGAVEPWDSTTAFKPVNYGGANETWGPPAPAGPYGDPGTAGTAASFASQFNGINANGTWSLYVITTASGDGTGAIAGGWCANITTGSAAATTTSVGSNNNPSFTTAPGNSVTLTATVHKASDASNVAEGTVAFTDGGTTIGGCGAVAVSAGQASCTTTFSSEGGHPVLAQYSGTANFGGSSASVTQVVNSHTTATGNSFCNTGSISLNNPTGTTANASPYPSNVFVTGAPGNITHLTVSLNNATYGHSQDIDALLVGPTGQTFIVVAAAGPNSGGAISNVTLTLDDSASSTISSSAAWGAPNATVTSKPVNYGGFNEAWGPPAPTPPYGNPGPNGGGTATLGSAYNGTNANGTWSLYAITTASGDGTGAIAGGWCVNITGPQPPTLTKSFGAPSLPLNGFTSLTFTVSNPNASSPLTGVGFTDTLPAGLVIPTPSGATGTCGGGTITDAAGTTSVTLSGATLASNATCSFSVNVTGTTAGSKVNTTSGASSVEGGTGTPATATLVVVAPPTLTKSFGAASVLLNQSTTLTFTVSNPNATASLSGVDFTDTLPSGLVISSPSDAGGTCGAGTITDTAGTTSVSLTGGTVPANGSCTFSVKVTGAVVGSQVNTTSAVTSIEGGTGSTATATLNVTSSSVQITKSFGASTIPVGVSTTLSFTITNPAGNGAQTGIAFTDTLPAGLVVSSPNGQSGTCGSGTITAVAASGSVALSGATLTDGAACTFLVSVTGKTAGVKNNSVTVSSTEGGTGNTANASITVVAPPTISKSFGAASVALNATTSMTFTVANPNATTSLSGIGFTDTLPAGLVVATIPGIGGTCTGTFTAAAGSGSVSLTGATLAAGSSCTFSVNVTGVAAGSKVNTTSAVTSTEGGTGTTATATLTVAAGPVQIAKSFGVSSIPVAGSTTLSFTINNPVANGTSTGIAFTDTLPAGLVVSSPNGQTGACGGGTITAGPGTTSVSLAGATLAGAATCTFSVSVTGTTAGVKNNSVTVSSTEGGTGNTSNASVTVVAPPTISKSFGAASVALNATTSMTFTVANPNATTSLSGIGFTDTLPAGLVVATIPGIGGTCTGTFTAAAGSGSASLTGATLAASGSCTLSVNVTGVAAGSKVNTTSAVTSAEGGTGTTATATLTVVAPPVIAKAFGAANIALNGTTSLTFTLTNPAANTVALTGVAFTDTLPSGLVVASPSNGASNCANSVVVANPASGSVTASGILLPVGVTCTISLNVIGTTNGVKNNSVTVSSTNGGTGNTATASVSVAVPPSIAKSFGAATIPVSGFTSLGFTITNPNASFALTGVGFTDTLPAGLVVKTPNGVTGACGGGTITAAAGSGSVSLSGATLAGAASCTFSVSVTGTTAGVKNNSVTVTSTDAGTGNTATASITVVAPPTLSKSFGAASVALNATTGLTFSVSNPNTTTSLSGIGFADTLPVGLVVASPPGTTGTCGGSITAVGGSGSVSLSGLTLAASGSCSFSVNVKGVAAGSQVNTTSAITSTEGGTGNTATATLTVVAPPVIAKAFGVANIALNGTTSLTFTITNPSTNTVDLTGVGFTDTLPAGMVVANPNGQSGACGSSLSATPASSTVSLSGMDVPPHSACQLSVNVIGTTNGVKNNSVTVSSTNGGTGNTATASVSVAVPPSIAKSFGAATIPVSGFTSLGFTITNPNASFALTGVGFTDTLPAGLVVKTPNGVTGACGGGTITATAGSGSVSLSGATLAGAASCTFSVSVTGTTAGVKNNSVTVTSTNAGTGNTATASITVVAAPTLSKSFGGASVPFGGSTSLSFVASNPNATVALTAVGFTDTLPAGLVVSTPNGVTGSCGGGTITATAGSTSVNLAGATLAASGGCTFAVNVTAVAVGVQNNTTSTITSANGGTGVAASASVTVVRAPTTTTVVASSPNPAFGTPVSFTATVVPSGPNGSGVNPTGSVSFFLDGSPTPIATVGLSGDSATFTTSGLGVGAHSVAATYNGDTNFLPSTSSSPATVTVPAGTTVTGTQPGTLVLGPGTTLIQNATITGAIVVPAGSALDLENSTVKGSITSNGATGVRICGSTLASVTINGSTGPVVVGDAKDGCAPNKLSGSLTLNNNTDGLQATGNTVAGSVTASGNSGAGPFPDDPAPDTSGNHH